LATIWVAGVDGVRLAGDLEGPEGAPTVFLTPGGGQTRHSWGTTLRSLVREGYRVLSLDHRGHGESEWSEDYRFELFGEDLAKVVPTVAGGAPYLLAGASLGGLASLYAAPALQRNGNGLAGIALVDVVPRVDPKGSDRILGFMRGHIDGFANLEAAAAAIGKYRHEKPRAKNLKGLAKNLRLRDGRYYWHWDPTFIEKLGGSAAGSARATATEALERAAEAVRVPTLLVRGALTDIVSPEGVEEFRKLIPHLEVEDVSDAGHIVVGDNNAVFETVIVAFLKRVLPLRR
jgi:pimeloyl-ACP methyl ester carboxylesterase